MTTTKKISLVMMKGVVEMGIMNSVLRKYAKSGRKVIQEMEEISKNPMDAQKKFLRKLLEKNANTVYGQEHDFQNIDIIEMFREKHPVTTYDDFVPYLSRMVDGEKDILVSDKVGHYSKTSGTVGVPKKIPLTKGILREKRQRKQLCVTLFPMHQRNWELI